MNVVDGDRVTTLHFAGVRCAAEEMLVVLARTGNEAMVLFDEMTRMNNEQANQLRELIKGQTEVVRMRADYDTTLYDQLSQLNNELATLQRELAQKNAALEKALSELRETQAMLIHSEKMSSLGQLAAGMAHEINNPLAYVINNLLTLESTSGDLISAYNALEDTIHTLGTADQQARAESIRQQADLDFVFDDLRDLLPATVEGVRRIQELVKNLGMFSRLDEAKRKETNIKDCVTSTLLMAQPYLHDKVTVNVELDSLPEIMAYPAELNQFFEPDDQCCSGYRGNGPAHDSRYSGRPRYCAQVCRYRAGDAPEIMSKVFDPFFTTKPVGSGTGLGLTVAYRIIADMHHGSIDVINAAAGQYVYTSIAYRGNS